MRDTHNEDCTTRCCTALRYILFNEKLIERITELSALRDIPNLTGRDKETLPSPDDVPTCVGLV